MDLRGRESSQYAIDLVENVDNKKKDILVVGEGSTPVLDSTTLTAEKKNIRLM